MTPAIRLLKKNKIKYTLYKYEHEASMESFGLEVVQKLFLDEQEVFKTLVISLNNNTLCVAIVPVCSKLSMKNIAKVLSVKKASMADINDVEKSTGYILGGVSPLGQKKRLKTIIDISAKEFKNIYVSGGQRGLEIELNPIDLQKLTNAIFYDIKSILNQKV